MPLSLSISYWTNNSCVVCVTMWPIRTITNQSKMFLFVSRKRKMVTYCVGNYDGMVIAFSGLIPSKGHPVIEVLS